MIYGLLGFWLLIGFLLTARFIWLRGGDITVDDLCALMVGAYTGPLIFIFTSVGPDNVVIRRRK